MSQKKKVSLYVYKKDDLNGPDNQFGIVEYADAAVPSNVPKRMVYGAYQIPEPVTMDEALDSDLSTEWKQATDSEYNSLLHNNTWDLVELPSNRRP